MLSGTWGNNLELSIFGESHGAAIGIVINGIKAGFEINMDKIEQDMERRAPGRNKMSTARKEGDKPKILSGLFEGKTTGAPITMIIENSDTRSKDYSKTKDLMRPGHADYSGFIKYEGFNDYRGGGHFSGRITAPLVFAGALAKQILEEQGIKIGAHIASVGKVKDLSFDKVNLSSEDLEALLKKELPLIDNDKIGLVKEEIEKTRLDNNSIGGTIECGVVGLKAGIGEPFFDSLESKIASLAFSVPAVKGIEFGRGFEFTEILGSEANDQYHIENNEVKTLTNNNGGIIGGISNGMPLTFKVAIKPTPSISRKQKTVDIKTMEEKEIEIVGRHDPCIVQRAVVVIEAIAAIGILELISN